MINRHSARVVHTEQACFEQHGSGSPFVRVITHYAVNYGISTRELDLLRHLHVIARIASDPLGGRRRAS
jgi:hypothetical protein